MTVLHWCVKCTISQNGVNTDTRIITPVLGGTTFLSSSLNVASAKILNIFFMAGEWEHWNKRVEEYLYPKDHNPDFLSILVPNVDNVRTDYLIQIVSKQGKVRWNYNDFNGLSYKEIISSSVIVGVFNLFNCANTLSSYRQILH